MQMLLRAVVITLLTAAPLLATDYPFEQLHPDPARVSNVPKVNRINIVFVSDGYGAESLDRYKAACAEIVKLLLEERPYKEYRNLFTFTRVDVPVKGPTTSQSAGTPDGEDYDPEWNLIWAANPKLPRHLVVVVTNAFESSASFSSRHGLILCDHPNRDLLVNALSHQIGHTIGRLLDEGTVERSGPPGELPPEALLPANLTRESDPGKVKWKAWIDAKILGPPVLGGMGRAQGIWRPKELCRMKYLSRAPFCEVCVEEHVRRFYTHISLLEPWSPRDELVLAPAPAVPVTVRAACVGPIPSTSVIGEWTLDGRLQEGKGTRSEGLQGPVFQLVIDPLQVTPGDHTLKFVATDTTQLVKDAKQDDPIYRRRPNVRTWTIRVPWPEAYLPALRSVATSLAE